ATTAWQEATSLRHIASCLVIPMSVLQPAQPLRPSAWISFLYIASATTWYSGKRRPAFPPSRRFSMFCSDPHYVVSWKFSPATTRLRRDLSSPDKTHEKITPPSKVLSISADRSVKRVNLY